VYFWPDKERIFRVGINSWASEESQDVPPGASVTNSTFPDYFSSQCNVDNDGTRHLHLSAEKAVLELAVALITIVGTHFWQWTVVGCLCLVTATISTIPCVDGG
jgi:hypothetical protein